MNFSGLKDLSCGSSNEFQIKFEFLHNKIKECQNDLKSCFDQIKSNESMMNYLMSQFQRLGASNPFLFSSNYNNSNIAAPGNCNYSPYQSSNVMNPISYENQVNYGNYYQQSCNNNFENKNYSYTNCSNYSNYYPNTNNQI